MSRSDRFEFTLDEEIEKRLYDLLTDMDTRNTDRFWIKDKRGYHAEYVKVIRCKDCKYCDVKNSGAIYAVCKKHDHKFYSFEDDTRECFCSWAEKRE